MNHHHLAHCLQDVPVTEIVGTGRHEFLAEALGVTKSIEIFLEVMVVWGGGEGFDRIVSLLKLFFLPKLAAPGHKPE